MVAASTEKERKKAIHSANEENLIAFNIRANYFRALRQLKGKDAAPMKKLFLVD